LFISYIAALISNATTVNNHSKAATVKTVAAVRNIATAGGDSKTADSDGIKSPSAAL